jgi:hypothetical protein
MSRKCPIEQEFNMCSLKNKPLTSLIVQPFAKFNEHSICKFEGNGGCKNPKCTYVHMYPKSNMQPENCIYENMGGCKNPKCIYVHKKINEDDIKTKQMKIIEEQQKTIQQLQRIIEQPNVAHTRHNEPNRSASQMHFNEPIRNASQMHFNEPNVAHMRHNEPIRNASQMHFNEPECQKRNYRVFCKYENTKNGCTNDECTFLHKKID